MNKGPKPAKKGDVLTAKLPRWRDDAEEGCYLAAFKYLTLFMDIELAFDVSNRLRDQDGPTVWAPARELLRAVELPLLDRVDVHVTHELVTISNGVPLSPVLCLRGDRKRRPFIADGYYRTCAAYYCDPDVEIPVKIV